MLFKGGYAMSVKEMIGKRIRAERERKGFSRESLCGCEEELTVRQLARIELGESLPSIVKLEYIAQVLDTDITTLLAGESISIPDEYFTMKYHLFKFPTYGDKERLAKKIQMVEDIYERYFDYLPEEELFTLELVENTLDYRLTGTTAAAEDIFEDFFKQLFLKKQYTVNDLLLVSYYALQCQNRDYDKNLLKPLEIRVIAQEISGDEYYNAELLGTLTAIAGVYLDHAEYAPIKELVERMYVVIAETQQHSAKPVALVYDAKYHLYVEHDIGKAKECYKLAILLAQNFGDTILETNIRMERENDAIK